MHDMTASTWKRTGSSIIWQPALLADLVRDVEPTPLRTMVGWLKTGFPENPPGGGRTVLVGGLQTVIDRNGTARTVPMRPAATLRFPRAYVWSGSLVRRHVSYEGIYVRVAEWAQPTHRHNFQRAPVVRSVRL